MAAEGVPDREPEGTFVLELPDDPAFVATARLFAGALARHFGCQEDTVQDVKLAVSEACTAAVADRGTAPVRLEAAAEGAVLRFDVCCLEGPPGRPAAGDARTAHLERPIGPTGVQLIGALFADAATVHDPDGTAHITFSVPLPEPR
ncbi:MAG TPA: ATP-binding protein [Actinomycetota bacterium]|nr:ATP-binding protein [Actinomycetota bacterium]